MFLRDINTREKFKHLVKKAMESIKTLVLSFDPSDNTFSTSIQDKELYQSTNLTQTLTDVFISIGEAAYAANMPICFFIDEIQYMKSEELGSLIAALHRANQLGYPLMVIGAGLPKIYKMISDEKSYSERLFVYKQVGSLSYDQAVMAITEPLKPFDVEYKQDAIDQIVKITKGYPYFIQEFCSLIYQASDKNYISIDDVNGAIEIFFETLDKGFFKVRYERCSEGEKKFIFAMVSCGELPCTISNVANHMGKSVNTISPVRGQLINKGIIYSARYGELDFTVPEFDGFIHRLDEYNLWCQTSNIRN